MRAWAMAVMRSVEQAMMEIASKGTRGMGKKDGRLWPGARRERWVAREVRRQEAVPT
jgi:hypothetical protein